VKKPQTTLGTSEEASKHTRNEWGRCKTTLETSEEDINKSHLSLFSGESFYNELIAPLVQELSAVGLVVQSQSAKCIFTSVDEIPLMVVKSDGGYGYDSTDIAAIWYRLYVVRADWLIYVTDMGQEKHFLKIFDAARQAGWHRPPTTRWL
jgi:arginyl-tRNA synthetase